MIKCENYLRYFKNYTDEYFTEVKLEDKFKIELKIVHTMYVLKAMRILAKNAGLTSEDYEIAKIIALFHDFGRFNQLKIYGHFNDGLSLNHAEESVREMQRLNILDKANDEYVPEYTKELIYKSILNHNRDDIVGEADEKLILMSKLIRDADKIDIYRTVENYVAPIDYDKYVQMLDGYKISKDISDNVYEKIKAGIKLKKNDIETPADDFIWKLYWSISDMNFPCSLKIIKEKKHLEKMYDSFVKYGKINDEGRLRELYNLIINELNKRVENGTI